MNEVAKEKRTLVNVNYLLQEKVKMLQELVNASDRLVDKFERTEGGIKEGQMDEKNPAQPDLIGLFEETASDIEKKINRIGRNLDKVLGLID